ncbi:MAG: phosphoadenylyl-sulfate reductase [Burkholderiaceae bacterium]|nr:phosphoadenylyl-sulfate reductase [Burkholderiaceae bacterium]
MSNYTAHLTETLATLARIAHEHAPAVFASSLAAEDMVLTDLILSEDLPITIFTLDTGRLHAETLQMIERVQDRYGYGIKIYRPDDAAVAAYVAQSGLNGFYDGIEQRKECCRIRKPPGPNCRWKNSIARTAWRSSTRWPTGARTTCGITSKAAMCRTTRCMTAATRRSAANPAPARFSRAKTSAPDDGGGNNPNRRNADCISSTANWSAPRQSPRNKRK